MFLEMHLDIPRIGREVVGTLLGGCTGSPKGLDPDATPTLASSPQMGIKSGLANVGMGVKYRLVSTTLV